MHLILSLILFFVLAAWIGEMNQMKAADRYNEKMRKEREHAEILSALGKRGH